MSVPSVWEFVLAALAVWRVWKLVSVDEILDRPRDFLAPEGTKRRDFLDCPYCSGFWLALAATCLYPFPSTYEGVLGFVATAFALSAAVVFIETVHDHLVLKKA